MFLLLCVSLINLRVSAIILVASESIYSYSLAAKELKQAHASGMFPDALAKRLFCKILVKRSVISQDSCISDGYLATISQNDAYYCSIHKRSCKIIILNELGQYIILVCKIWPIVDSLSGDSSC